MVDKAGRVVYRFGVWIYSNLLKVELKQRTKGRA